MISKQLYSHLKDKGESEALRSRIEANSELFERPVSLVETWIKDARKKQLELGSYDSPSWSERQADLNGYQRALEEIKQLLTI